MSNGPAKRQSWKQGKQSTTAKQGPNKPARWLLTLLAMGLLTGLFCLLWVLFTNKTMPTHLVVQHAGQSGARLPSLPHSAHDLQPLTEIEWSYFRFQDQSELLQSDRSLAAVGSDAIDESGVLIIYVSAHGVTNITADGSVNILCRDYDLAAPQRGVFEVSDWLKELRNSNAGTKLLVFDSGTIVSDPRLGMLVNDFPRRVIELVEQWDDASVWVMLSNATFQTPLIAGANDQSLFGTAFVEGLLGNADLEERGGNRDNDVSLDELYRYVFARCTKISADLQKPLLIHAGTPINELFNLPALPLLAINAKVVAEDAADEQEGSEGTSETGMSGDSAANQTQVGDDLTATTAGADQAAGQEKDLPATVVAGDAVGESANEADAPQDELIRAWKLRDQIESVSVAEGWAPQEYAPHLWRQLLDFLVEFDLRRASADDPFELILTQHVSGLNDLRTCLKNPNQSISANRGGLVVNELVRATRSFLTGNASRDFEPASQRLREVADAVREVRRISFLMPYFVRWHANAGLVGVADDTVARRIQPLLAKLIAFQRDYERLRGKRLPAFVDMAKTQRDITQDYGELTRYLRQHIKEVCEPQPSIELKARVLLQARALLSGPLPTAGERENLLQVVNNFQFSEEPTRGQVRNVALPQLDDVDRRQDLEEQLQLEQSLIGLCDTQWRTLFLSPERDGEVGNLSGIGASLREFYQNLASELTDVSAANPSRLSLVDARDASRIGWRDGLALRLEIDPPDIKPVLTIVGAPSLLELSDGKPQIVELHVSSNGESTNQGRITYSFDPRVDFRPLGGTSFRLDKPSELRFRVTAKPGTGELRRRIRPIVINASLAGFVDGKQEIETWLAGPDRVDLVVTPMSRVEMRGNSGGVLRTYPNRVTPFRFAIRNPSSKEKTIVVSLYRVPLSLANYIAPGRLFTGLGQVLTRVERATLEGGRPSSGLKLIAASKPLTVPPGAASAVLDFSAPSPAPAAEGEKTGEGTKPVPETKPAGKLDVSQGILCEIKEQGPAGEAWLSWIEFRTRTPRNYVKAVVSYDLAKLAVTCSLDPKQSLPNLAEQPVPIDWNLSQLPGEINDAMGNVINTDAIKSRANPAELIKAEIEPMEDKLVRMRLDVDDYPRALAFDVKLNEASTYSEPREDISEVRLISISMTGHPTKYVTSPAFLPSKPDEKNPVVLLQYRNGQRDKAAFPAAQRGSQLELSFQVDAPIIAFGEDSLDKLTLRIDTPGFDPITLFGDRDAKFTIEKVGPDGLVSIHNAITDYVKRIDLEAVKGTYELVAELETSDDYQSRSILLTFDDTPPRLTKFQVPRRIRANSALPLSLVVEDESGLETVEYGIVDEPSATPQKMTPIRVPIQEPVLLPTKGLEVGQRYYVKLRLVDRAGNELVTDGKRRARQPLEFSLFEPTPVVGPSGEVQPGTIKGKVMLGDYGPRRFQVELTGGKFFAPASTGSGGTFEFKEVPPGDYVLKASGDFQNRGNHVGEAKISIEKQEDFAQQVIIKAALEKN